MDRNSRFFGEFELDRQTFRLLKAGTPVPVEPKALDLLGLLVDRAPRVVEKSEIFSQIWKDVSVTDNALTRLIAQLRKALDDDPKAPRYIETVATRGYRFVADVRATPATSTPIATQPERTKSEPRMLVVATLAGVSMLLGIGGYVMSRQPPRVASRIDRLDATMLASLQPRQLTSSSGLDAFPALSPDGLTLAFSSDRSGSMQVYVQSLASGSSPTMLTSDSRQNVQPEWSPDGQFIAYHAMATDGIWIVPARGGSPRQVSEFGSAPAWSPDGRRLAFQSQAVTEVSPFEGTPAAASTLWIVDVSVGRPEPLTTPEHPPGVHFVPIWSPDARRVYFCVSLFPGSIVGPQSIWWVDPVSHATASIAASPQLTRYLSVSATGDQLIYGARDTGLPWRLPIDPKTGSAVGQPAPIGLAGMGPGARQLVASPQGHRFVWTSMNQTSNIWSMAIEATSGHARGEPIALTDDAGTRATLPIVSSDGRIAFTGSRPGQRSDVYLLIPGGTPRQLTIDPGDDWSLTWSADGREIFAEETRNDRTDFVLIDPDSGRTRTLFDDTLFNPRGLIPNGRHWYDPANGRLAVGLLTDGLANVWIGIAREHDVKPMKQLTAETEGGSYPAISPDGRLVAYQCTEGSSTHVCLIPVEGGTREQLTHEPGQSWVSGWAPDNDRIVYAARRNAVWNLAWVSRSSRQTHTLTSFTRPNQFVRYPAWAPGRDRIIFERSEVTGRIWTVEIP